MMFRRFDYWTNGFIVSWERASLRSPSTWFRTRIEANFPNDPDSFRKASGVLRYVHGRQFLVGPWFRWKLYRN